MSDATVQTSRTKLAVQVCDIPPSGAQRGTSCPFAGLGLVINKRYVTPIDDQHVCAQFARSSPQSIRNRSWRRTKSDVTQFALQHHNGTASSRRRGAVGVGGIHLDLYVTGYHAIPTIGPLFLLQTIAALAAGSVIALYSRPIVASAGALLAIGPWPAT